MEDFKGTKGYSFPLNFGGHWELYDGEFYEDRSLLDAEQVGEEEAEANALLFSKAYEMLEFIDAVAQSEGVPIVYRKHAAELIKSATTLKEDKL